MKRVHVERHIVQLAFVIGDWRIDKMIELAKLPQVVPYRLIIRAENVRTISMDVDTVDFLGIAVASDVIALLKHKHGPAPGNGFMRDDRPKQAASNNEDVVMSHGIPLSNCGVVCQHTRRHLQACIQFRSIQS